MKLFLDIEIRADTIIMKNHILHWAKWVKAFKARFRKGKIEIL